MTQNSDELLGKSLRNAALHPFSMIVLGVGVATAILTGQWWIILVGIPAYGIVTLSNLKRAFEELQAEAREAQEESLDSLAQRLQADEDPRTSKLLSELRFLNATFSEGTAWPDDLSSDLLFEICTKVEELFQRCVAHIEHTLKLWHIAHGLDSGGREMILNQRESIIQEVKSSVEQLGSILASVLSLGDRATYDTELARIRRELDQILETARQVEQELGELEAVDIRGKAAGGGVTGK